jgi:hypothetical protein
MDQQISSPRIDFRRLVHALPEGWRDRMSAHGLIPTHPDTKLDEPEELMQLVLLHVGCDLPLRQTVRWHAESGGTDCSHVTLHRKMRRIGPFLREQVARMADERLGVDAERWAGYELTVLDGSVVVSPGPSGAGGRLHVALRVADLSVVGAQITCTDEGETLRRFAWSPNELVIADRGYANPGGIAHVVSEGADIIVRVNRGALPLFDETGERIDLLRWVRSLSGRRAAHRGASVHSDDEEIRGRIVAQRIPADKVAKAKRRVRREVGPDAETLELAEWMIIFTTVPIVRLTDAQVIDAYRLRWQVELLFKRWKSLCHIDKLPNYRKDTLVSWLTGKLLLLLCAERIATPAPKRRTRALPLARQPWKLTSIIWPAIIAALTPMSLDELPPALPRIADALDRDHPNCSPRQIASFVRDLGARADGSAWRFRA